MNYHQKYYFKNKERILKLNRLWRQRNVEFLKIYFKEYYTKNRGILMAVANERQKSLYYKFWKRWYNMHERCYNPAHSGYKNWGGRGIQVSKAWQEFEKFRIDMYGSFLRHYSKHGSINTTLDRIDSDKNYSKSNCRWATMKEQQNNRRK